LDWTALSVRDLLSAHQNNKISMLNLWEFGFLELSILLGLGHILLGGSEV